MNRGSLLLKTASCALLSVFFMSCCHGAARARNPDEVRLTLAESPLGSAAFDPTAPCAVSSDGQHILYGFRASGDDGWSFAIDGQPGDGFFDEIYDPIFDRLGRRTAFYGKRGQQRLVVIDGVEGKPYGTVQQLQFSDDGSRVGYIGNTETDHRVVIDGIEGKSYPAGVSSLVFSADGKHAAYFARRSTPLGGPSGEVVVVDGVEGQPFRRLIPNSLCYSSDSKHLAFVATLLGNNRANVQVFVDGQARPGIYDELPVRRSDGRLLFFSPDSRHLAFLAKRNGQLFWVVDGREHPADDAVDANTFQFSRDSAHWAYASDEFVVVDGQPGAHYRQISDLRLGLGGRYAYLASRGEERMYVTEAGPGMPYSIVSGAMFSDDGQHFAYVASRDGSQYVVVLDGKEQDPFAEVKADSLRFSPDGNHLAYMASKTAGPKEPFGQNLVVRDNSVIATFNGLAVMNPDTLTFSPDSRHLAFTVRQLDVGTSPQTVVVVDGVASTPFDSLLPKSVLVFDGPNRLRMLGSSGEKIVRIDVAIEDAK